MNEPVPASDSFHIGIKALPPDSLHIGQGLAFEIAISVGYDARRS
jgi:hypothetical protein